MEISSLINKTNGTSSKSVQPQPLQDSSLDNQRNIQSEENQKYVYKNKVDSAEISSAHVGTFEDKRLAVAKSAILSDVAAETSAKANIDEIKNKIANGTYEIPADKIADAMLATNTED